MACLATGEQLGTLTDPLNREDEQLSVRSVARCHPYRSIPSCCCWRVREGWFTPVNSHRAGWPGGRPTPDGQP